MTKRTEVGFQKVKSLVACSRLLRPVGLGLTFQEGFYQASFCFFKCTDRIEIAAGVMPEIRAA